MRWLQVMVLVAASSVAHAGAYLEFGNVDVGATKTGYLNVSQANTGTASIASAAIVNDTDNWFEFTTTNTATATFAPALDLTTGAKLIGIRCTPPANSSGGHAATVQFPGGQDATITCSASQGIFSIIPKTGVLDFSGVDIDRVPDTVQGVITIQNIGNATVQLQNGVLTGTQFTTSSLVGPTLAPMQKFVITVTYQPSGENIADAGTLSFQSSGPANQTVLSFSLMGHGIDRHATLMSAGPVPDTFLKPGPLAPMVPIVIANTGGAALGLTNPVLTSGAEWNLFNPQNADVPGGSSFTYYVRFYPQVVGAAPPATLTVQTTDPDVPTLVATLNGNGKARNVTLGPDVDMQYVAVATTGKISDGTRGPMLEVTNNDPANAFTIGSFLVVDAENAFEIVGAHGTVLQPGSTTSFDVAFTPTHEGSYDGTAQLVLDEDPDVAATMKVHGDGVFVTAGGGGCSATNGGTGVMMIALVLWIVGRRRVAIVIALAGAAHADTRNLDLSLFDPTPSTNASWFQLQSADVGHEGDWAVTALASYLDDPLVLRSTPNDNVSVQDRMMFELGGAFAFGDRFEAGLRFPLYVQSGENLNSPTMFGEPGASGTAAGNLTVHAKARIWRGHGPVGDIVVGASTALELPTESDAQFAGSSKPQLDAIALVTMVPAFEPRLAFDVQAGAVFRSDATFHDVQQGTGMQWGAGVMYRVRPALAVQAELFGELDPGGVHDAIGNASALNAIEVLGGFHYQMERRVAVGVAVGRGLTDAPGSPTWHGVLAVTVTPMAPKQIQGLRSHDPQGDNDHDGIPNDVDKCPDEPEDKDGFEDDDGCPDYDNDGDGITDAKDKCPNLAEDKDGFEDQDGCPDPDNDHDGIADRFDHCPNDPETINGVDDEDGCPDQGPPGLVKLDKDVITLDEPVEFAGAKLAQQSFNVMGQLGATLRAHTELIKIRVKGKQAQVVVDWLVQYGIAAERLEAVAGAGLEITVVDRY
ncbi:MAG: MYXO-CTERM sorting domain-containing protein [Kofleriaceae bacterium]